MSDDNKNLPVPSGDKVPAKRTGTDIAHRPGTDVKASSTDLAHRASTDPTIAPLDSRHALVPYEPKGGAVGEALNPSEKPAKTKGLAKWAFGAAALAAAALVVGALASMDGDDGARPQQYCADAGADLVLRSDSNSTAATVGSLPAGKEFTGTGRLIDGFRQVALANGDMAYVDYTKTSRPVNGLCPS